MQYPQYREEGPGKKRVDEKKKRERGGGRRERMIVQRQGGWKGADATTMPKKMDKVQKQ